MVLVLLLAFAIRGTLRGTIAQVFAFFGFTLGLWSGAWVLQWVGMHWQGAQPKVVFLVLRWTVAVIAGLGIAALFQWWGELVAKAAHDGPFGWLDRIVGGVVGLALGAMAAALVVLLAVQAPGLGFARTAAFQGRTARPLIRQGTRCTSFHSPLVPGSRWLHGEFVSAEGRLGVARSH